MSVPWTEERTRRFKQTMAQKKQAGWKKPQPAGFRRGPDQTQRTRRPVTDAQRIVINPRTHRAKDTLGEIHLPKKPSNRTSWWMADQRRETQEEWFAKAKAELPLMIGTREEKSLGQRKVVDEIGRSL